MAKKHPGYTIVLLTSRLKDTKTGEYLPHTDDNVRAAYESRILRDSPGVIVFEDVYTTHGWYRTMTEAFNAITHPRGTDLVYYREDVRLADYEVPKATPEGE